jgi:peptidoglycan/LPS O-acetylase OafA/YrhL
MSLLSSVLLAVAEETTPTPTPEVQLDGEQGAWTLAAVVVFILLAGLLIVGARWGLEGRSGSDDRTTVRAWLAISLVGGLLIFTAAAFWFDDTTLRSTLVGGVVANAGAAVAFYFASKASDQARKDILTASMATVIVPDLKDKDRAAVEAAMAALPLTLVLDPVEPEAGAVVTSQQPPALTPTHAGSTVTAKLEKPAATEAKPAAEVAKRPVKVVKRPAKVGKRPAKVAKRSP